MTIDEKAKEYESNIGSQDYVPIEIEEAFKAGAEWMARQGETSESLIWRDEDDKLFVEVFVDENKFKMAENVTIQIRKKSQQTHKMRKMSKHIDADKLIAEIESRMEDCKLPNGKFPTTTNAVRYEELSCIRNLVDSLQQEKTNGTGGIVHHALDAHWIMTDKEQLDTILREFPEGAEVELFICAKKEGEQL